LEGELTQINESINLKDLNWDDQTFAISSFVPSDHLENSLQRFGILHPPWIWQKSRGNKVIVDGFKRLGWARRKDIESVECRVFPTESGASELMIRRMEAKFFGPPLNAAEKAQVINKLSQWLSPEEMLHLCLPLLGIAPRLDLVRKWCRLAGSSEPLLMAAAREEICERVALELLNWDDEPRSQMVSLLLELRCSASIQFEIVERLKEIALREETNEQQVLGEESVKGIIADENLNHRQKTNALRQWLYGRRYPRLKAREERFKRELAASNLPKNVRILPPPGFEGTDWQLHLHFRDQGELSESLFQLRELMSSKKLTSLI